MAAAKPQTARYLQFKQLLHKVATRLGEADVRSLVFNQDLPEELKDALGIDVLQRLEREGLFSDRNIQPLAELLRAIERHDLVNNYVEEYIQKFGRESEEEEKTDGIETWSSGNHDIVDTPPCIESFSYSAEKSLSQGTVEAARPQSLTTIQQYANIGSGAVPKDQSVRRHQFKLLLHKVGTRLGEADVRSLVFNKDLPWELKDALGIDVLHKLEREGLFSDRNIYPLAELLRNIERLDLINIYVEEYIQKFGRESKEEEKTDGIETWSSGNHDIVDTPPCIESFSYSAEKSLSQGTVEAARPQSLTTIQQYANIGSGAVPKDQSVRRHQFKLLLHKVGTRLGEIDVRSLVFNEDLPGELKDALGIDVLHKLEREGLFSDRNIYPLAELLRNVERFDLVNIYVEEYIQKFGREFEEEEKTDGSGKLCEVKMEVEENPRGQPIFSYNTLLGVEIVGEEELVVTNEAMSFQWKDYGFKLHIPENALPEGVSEYLVNIKVSLAGQFELPKEYELVSAVYWVRTPGKFKKPITIETQHCANFRNPRQLCFVRTSCAQKSLPYKFKVIDGGSFSLSSKYGVLSTTHFSGTGIAKKVTPGEQSCQYCAQVYFTVKHLQDHWYYCHFVVTKDLEMCLAVVRRKYRQEYDIAPPISFGGDHVALDIPNDGIQTGNGWEIKPLHKACIKKDRVNNFSSESTWLPECVLLLKWKQRNKAPEPLEYKVKLLGTGDDDDFFLIVHHPRFQFHPLASPVQTDGPTASTVVRQQTGSPQDELTTDDILDVKKYLLNLGHTDIHCLGLTLGLNHLHLKSMREDSDTFKEDMIAAWLQKEDQVTRRGLPTWETLVKALRDDQVKQTGVADRIAFDKNLLLPPEIIDSSS